MTEGKRKQPPEDADSTVESAAPSSLRASRVQVRLLSTGEPTSLDVHRLYRIANAALKRIVGHKPRDYDDLLQVVVERVVRTIQDGTFSGECSLSTWTSVIASNVAIDWMRRASRVRARLELTSDPDILDADGARALPNPERHLEARSLLRYAEHVLDGMTPALRETVILHHVHDHDLAEIATASHVSVAAAQSRLVRGREELKRRLRAATRTERPRDGATSSAERREIRRPKRL
ncbi:MAG TPA: RNA polymerase sigma factor [Polyangiaceae bacterium]